MGNQPLGSTVHIDAALTNYTNAYVQSAEDFIATKVFPLVTVNHQSGKYFTYTKNDWFRDEARKRAPADESAGSGYNMSTDNYSCDVYAFHKDVPDQIAKNADIAINAESDAARFVAQRMLLKHEIEWAATFFTTSVWTTDVTGGSNFTQWDNYASSRPLVDVQTGKETVLGRTGLEPNTLILGYQVWSDLINHPDFVDRIKFTSPDAVNAGTVAKLLGVDRLLVMKAVKATNVENETAAYSFVAGKHALLCHVAPLVGLLTATAGATFVWQDVSDGQAGMGANVGTVRIPIPEKRVLRIESQMAWDSKVVGADLGYFFASAVS